jgi:hypothetical protein
MPGKTSPPARTVDHDSDRPRSGGLCRRVAAAAAATMMAVGGAVAVAPSASAQDLPTDVQGSYEALPPDVRSIVSSVATSGPVSAMALYYFVWCPLTDGSIDRPVGACSF